MRFQYTEYIPPNGRQERRYLELEDPELQEFFTGRAISSEALPQTGERVWYTTTGFLNADGDEDEVCIVTSANTPPSVAMVQLKLATKAAIWELSLEGTEAIVEAVAGMQENQ